MISGKCIGDHSLGNLYYDSNNAICYFMYENDYIVDDNGCAVSTNMEDVCEMY